MRLAMREQLQLKDTEPMREEPKIKVVQTFTDARNAEEEKALVDQEAVHAKAIKEADLEDMTQTIQL